MPEDCAFSSIHLVECRAEEGIPISRKASAICRGLCLRTERGEVDLILLLQRTGAEKKIIRKTERQKDEGKHACEASGKVEIGS